MILVCRRERIKSMQQNKIVSRQDEKNGNLGIHSVSYVKTEYKEMRKEIILSSENYKE